MASNETPDLRPCILCGQAEDDRFRFGEKYSSVYEEKDVVVHYLCVLFSCALKRSSENDEAGIQGFAEKDILAEAKRGKRLRCAFCKKMGATLGCCVGPKCNLTYHYPCAADQEVHFIASGQFESFCRKHRKLKPIVISEQLEEAAICASCFESVELPDTDLPDVIQCKCCKHVCHKICVQKFAYISGMHHFKCSFCNCNDLPDSGLTESQARLAHKCKKRYVAAAQHRGVYIPEKDADWELDSSFDMHESEFDKCDIEDENGQPACKCARGTEYDESEHKRKAWYIVNCSLCAAHGCHRQCRNIAAKDCAAWVCDFCTDALSKTKENRQGDSRTAASSVQNPANSNPAPRPSSSTSTVRSDDANSKKSKKEKVHRAERCRLNLLANKSAGPSSHPLPAAAAAPQPAATASASASHKRSATSSSSTANTANKKWKVEVITLSDSE